MAKPLVRIAAVQLGFVLVIPAILARAAQLQMFQGERWAEQARRQRTERAVLRGPAWRVISTETVFRSQSARSFFTSGLLLTS